MRPGLAAAAAAAAGTLLLSTLSCFSERGTTAPAAGQECRIPVGSDLPGSTLVIIRNFAFEPATVTIRAGATVTWVNCDEAGQPSHTSTADAGAWSSPTLAPGEAFSHTFDQSGSLAYHCEPHPFMTGSVTVE
jgi:plastocyanin